MKRDEYEQLDVFEVERILATTLIDLIDDPHEQHIITLALLTSRSGLPKRRVRELTEEWELRTMSGDEYMLTPELVERVRELLLNPRRRD
jgi:hypothetical protein